MLLLDIFINNLLPVLLLAGAGFILGKLTNVSSRPLGRVVFYIFSPVLVFDLITRSQLSTGGIGLMAGFAACVMLVCAGMAYLLAKLLHLEKPALIAVVLTAMIGNNGNYGLPIIAFAFGEKALAYASIYFVTSITVLNTLGVFIASLGHLNPKEALLRLMKIPAIYAILLGIIVINTGIVLPSPLQKAVSLTSNAAVPSMLVLLGLELQQVAWTRNIKALGIPVFLRLVAGPLIALGFAALFGLPPLARQAGVTEAGMPSAVMTTVLASEFNLDSSLVTSIVFVTTVISPVTLTVLLLLVGR
jgi:predicted permease